MSETQTDGLDWLTLDDGEEIQWHGTRRTLAVLPSVIGGTIMALIGLSVVAVSGPGTGGLVAALGGGVSVVAGLVLIGWRFLDVRHTVYVATNRGLYRKRGVVGRTVSAVDYETIQNVTYSQTITGTLFDHGTLTFDTAGGTATELSFDDIDDPRPVERLVDDRLARVRGDDGDGDSDTPGTIAQWLAVREEVVGIRSVVDDRYDESLRS